MIYNDDGRRKYISNTLSKMGLVDNQTFILYRLM